MNSLHEYNLQCFVGKKNAHGHSKDTIFNQKHHFYANLEIPEQYIPLVYGAEHE